jgi:hypothetical protein
MLRDNKAIQTSTRIFSAIYHRVKIISTSGLAAAIFNFGSQTTSDNVRSDILKSGMVDNAGMAVGIAAPSLAI